MHVDMLCAILCVRVYGTHIYCLYLIQPVFDEVRGELGALFARQRGIVHHKHHRDHRRLNWRRLKRKTHTGTYKLNATPSHLVHLHSAGACDFTLMGSLRVGSEIVSVTDALVKPAMPMMSPAMPKREKQKTRKCE